MEQSTEIFKNKIIKALEHGGKNSIEIAKYFRTEFKEGESPSNIRKIINNNLKEQVYFDVDSGVYRLVKSNDEIDRGNNLFSISLEFTELNKKISDRQVIFMTASPEERKTIYAQELISLSKEIENSFPNILEFYNNLNQIKKQTIRNSICAAFKLKIDQNSIVLPSFQEQVQPENRNTIEQIPIKKDWQIDEKGRNSLLFPFIYSDFPSLIEIQENIEDYKSTLLSFVENSGITSISSIKELLIAVEQDAQSTDDEIKLFWIIYELKNRSGNISLSNEINKLNNYLKNPIKEFFMLIDRNVENISFASENPKFHKILKEIGRDNIITENERNYIFEKAEEHFIDKSKLTIYLDNPFIGFESFKIFIDQICEDGIISSVERTYIDEKAQQYNVSTEKVEEMISVGLMRAAKIEKLSNKKEFYDVILVYLFAHSFNIHAIGNILFKALYSKNIYLLADLQVLKELVFDELLNRLIKKSCHFRNSNTIKEVLELIELKSLSYEDAFKQFHNNSVKKDEDRIREIDENSFEWKVIENRKINSSIQIDYKNKTLYIKSLIDTLPSNLFIEFINNLFNTRNKHRSPEIDLFFENFEDFYNET
jgi:hypothetical protein